MLDTIYASLDTAKVKQRKYLRKYKLNAIYNVIYIIQYLKVGTSPVE